MRFTKVLSFIVLPFLLLGSCTRRPVEPRFETLAVDTLLGSEENGCRVEYRFATIVNADRSDALKAIEQSNISYFFELEEFAGTADDAATQAVRDLGQELKLPGGLTGEVSIEAETEVRDTLLTYIITRSSFTGGAHGLYSIEHHTYSLPGGYEIMLGDLFPVGFREKLDTLIRTKLYAQYEISDDEGLAAAGFFPETIIATENFRLTPDNIIFFYNPYEIGCYALGNVEVSIPQAELEQLLVKP